VSWQERVSSSGRASSGGRNSRAAARKNRPGVVRRRGSPALQRATISVTSLPSLLHPGPEEAIILNPGMAQQPTTNLTPTPPATGGKPTFPLSDFPTFPRSDPRLNSAP